MRSSRTKPCLIVEFTEAKRSPDDMVAIAYELPRRGLRAWTPTTFKMAEEVFGMNLKDLKIKRQIEGQPLNWTIINKECPKIDGRNVHLRIIERTSPTKFHKSRGIAAIKQIPGDGLRKTEYFVTKVNGEESPIYREVRAGLYDDGEIPKNDLIQGYRVTELQQPVAEPTLETAAAPTEEETINSFTS